MAEIESVEIKSFDEEYNPSLEEESTKFKELVDPDRPEWLPEKFSSMEEMAKAYTELEKKQSRGQKVANDIPTEETSEEIEEEESTEESQEETEKAAREATKEAGLDFDDLSRQYWEAGELDEDAYAKLEKSGIPKHVVDSFIQGQEALLDRTRNEVFGSVGGEENYQAMVGWAADTLPIEEVEAYNKAVNSADLNTAKMAVAGLKARFNASEGFEPTRSVKGTTAQVSSQSYRSLAEMRAEMSDPRYKVDPAFRREVEKKLSNSDIF
jgi:hypothetical protein